MFKINMETNIRGDLSLSLSLSLRIYRELFQPNFHVVFWTYGTYSCGLTWLLILNIRVDQRTNTKKRSVLEHVLRFL